MPRYETNRLSKKEQKELQNKLFEAIKLLKSKQEIIDFFRDLLTQSETIMLTRRLQIAQMLMAEKNFYEIKNELHTSFDTINSVKHFLEHGHNGYQKVIEKINS